MECCVGLVQLYLYSNRISGIQGLDKLVYLEKLWLNSNRLSRLEGLGNLGNLRDLNLAGNTLTSIRGAVEHLRKLEIFDLSGNQISSFEVSQLHEADLAIKVIMLLTMAAYCECFKKVSFLVSLIVCFSKKKRVYIKNGSCMNV